MADEQAPPVPTSDSDVAAEVFAKLTANPAPSEEEDKTEEASTEAAPAEDAASTDDPSEEAEQAQEEPKEAEEAASKVTDEHEVEVKGEKVTLKELKRGFLRERDYTQKTQALKAREREVEQGIETERKQYRESLAEVKSFVEMIDPLSAYDKLDWMQLARDDQANGTNNYSLLKAQYDQLKAGREKLSTARQAAQEKERKEYQSRMAAWADEQVHVIGERFPDVKDPVKAKALAKEMDDYAIGIGFTERELLSNPIFRDAKMFQIVRDASLYRKGEAARKTAETKKVITPTKVIAPTGGREPTQGNSREKQALKRKALTASSSRDAADAILRQLHMR